MYSSSVQSLSRVWLFVTPSTAACQASLSITTSQSLLKLMSIESVMEVALNNLSASNSLSSIRSADPWDLSGRAVAAGAPGLPVCCSLPVWLLPVDIKLQLSVEYSLSLNEYCWYTWVEIGCLNYFASSYFCMPVHHEARYSDLPRHKVRHVWQCSIIKWKWGWRRQGLSRAEGKVACVKEVAHMSMAPTHISHSWAQ